MNKEEKNKDFSITTISPEGIVEFSDGTFAGFLMLGGLRMSNINDKDRAVYCKNMFDILRSVKFPLSIYLQSFVPTFDRSFVSELPEKSPFENLSELLEQEKTFLKDFLSTGGVFEKRNIIAIPLQKPDKEELALRYATLELKLQLCGIRSLVLDELECLEVLSGSFFTENSAKPGPLPLIAHGTTKDHKESIQVGRVFAKTFRIIMGETTKSDWLSNLLLSNMALELAIHIVPAQLNTETQISVQVSCTAVSEEKLVEACQKLLACLSLCGLISETEKDQLEGFLATRPIGRYGSVHPQSFPLSAFASVFPFINESFKSGKVFLGVNRRDSSLVALDRFTLANPHSISIGSHGSGMSFAAKIEALRLASAEGVKIMIIDTDGSYATMAESLKIPIKNISEIKESLPDFESFMSVYDISKIPSSQRKENLQVLLSKLVSLSETVLGERRLLILDNLSPELCDEKTLSYITSLTQHRNIALHLVVHNFSLLSSPMYPEARAVIENIPNQFLLKPSTTDSVEIKRLYNVSEESMALLTTLEIGQAVLLLDTKEVAVQYVASYNEFISVA